MRTLETIPHPNMLISIMYMNEKFILKFESGPYEQIYKFTKDMAADVEAVKKICDENFIDAVQKSFNQMHENFKAKFSL